MVLKKIRSVIERAVPEGTVDFSNIPLEPKRPFYAIGDIHGRDGLIEPLLEAIDQDIEEHNVEDPALIFLGDYIDRGPSSARVLEHVHELAQTMPDSVFCLMGNHERMMLDFLDNPVNAGPRWFEYGGLTTLASYDVPDLDKMSKHNDLIEAAVLLGLTLPDGVEDWLRNLPMIWTSGNVSCVHAGMNPILAPDQQPDQNLLWGHPDFHEVTRIDKHWVIHGHTVVRHPQNKNGKISIDTGAWKTNLLTAVAVTKEKPRFLADPRMIAES